MATIERRNGTYRVKVRRKGQPTQTATFHNLTDAKNWIHITEAAILERRHLKVLEAQRHTLEDLIDRYIQDILPRKSRSSIYMQTQQLHWWKSHLGNWTLADITPAVIAEHRDKLARGRSNATVRRYLAALSHAFTIAVREWHWLDDSPMRKVSRPKEPRGRVRFLSDDERQRLLAACQTSRNPRLYIPVVLALSTGARKMELLSLTWRDVDLKHGVIALNQTKNGEPRKLPLTGYALDLMRNHRTDTALVFPNRRGTKPMDIRTVWEHVIKRAGIENFTFHDLRHTAAYYLAMNGASLLEIGEILGHRDLQMAKRYTHLTAQHTANVVKRMNDAVFGLITHGK